MTINDLIELESIARDVMYNAIDNHDVEQFAHGLKLWRDVNRQLKERTAHNG